MKKCALLKTTKKCIDYSKSGNNEMIFIKYLTDFLKDF